MTTKKTNPIERLSQVVNTIPPLSKDTQGHGYKYVTLDSIQKAVNPILQEHGLLLMDSMVYTIPGKLVLRTCIVDVESGNVISSTEFPINEETKYGEDKNGNPRLCAGGPQDIGSARTYAARYNRATLLDLQLVGEDDDAAGAYKGGGSAPKAPTNTTSSGDITW